MKTWKDYQECKKKSSNPDAECEEYAYKWSREDSNTKKDQYLIFNLLNRNWNEELKERENEKIESDNSFLNKTGEVIKTYGTYMGAFIAIGAISSNKVTREAFTKGGAVASAGLTYNELSQNNK